MYIYLDGCIPCTVCGLYISGEKGHTCKVGYILLHFQMSLASGGLIVTVQIRPMVTQQEGLPAPTAIKKENQRRNVKLEAKFTAAG